MGEAAAIGPGARVRSRNGYIGTIERLEHGNAASDASAEHMLVRSDDGRWHYRLPLALVTRVARKGDDTIASVRLRPDDLPRYLVKEDGAQMQQAKDSFVQSADGSPEAAAHDEAIRIPLAAEELVVRTRPIELGKARIHKRVRTFEQRMTVPVRHEEVVVERIPPDQYDGGIPTDPNEVIVPVVEERLVVQKQLVVREYVRIRKREVVDQKEIRGMVRREYVEVTDHTDHQVEASGLAPDDGDTVARSSPPDPPAEDHEPVEA